MLMPREECGASARPGQHFRLELAAVPAASGRRCTAMKQEGHQIGSSEAVAVAEAAGEIFLEAAPVQ